MSKIYTRTGDKGETSLFTGDRVAKNDATVHALGTLDECNSTLGMALAFFPPLEKYKTQLNTIQHALFDLGAAVATPRDRASAAKVKKTSFGPEATLTLERWMDEMDSELSPLKAFILPGGHPSAATLHLARNICRRAERHVIPLFQSEAISDHVISYLNRLSDYLFMLARMVNHLTSTPEVVWKHEIS